MLWSAITDVAETQCGLIAAWQVFDVGGTEDWIRWAVRRDHLARIRRGVYGVVGSPAHNRELMAVCLACGRNAHAGVSHLAATHLWGAQQVKDGHLQATAFDHRAHVVRGATIHSSRLDPTFATTTWGDLPIVVPALAVVQVAKTADARLVRSIANDLVKRNATSFAEILEWVDRAHDGRRPELEAMCRQALDIGGHYDSPSCRMLCERLDKGGAGGYQLDFQVVDSEGVMRVDIAWPPEKSGIEYNGARDHDNPLARAKDARRRNRLAAQGWTILEANRTMNLDEIVRWALQTLAAAKRPA